jgi:hypothetical protein
MDNDVRSLVTVVITTSPVVSHPSLTLLESVLKSFVFTPDLWACSKVIVCDGCRSLPVSSRCQDYVKRDLLDSDHDGVDASVEGDIGSLPRRKYGRIAKAMRSGYVDTAYLEKYNEFKCRLRDRCDMDKGKSWHPADAPFADVAVMCLEERCGYGFTLKEALLPENGLVDTKYVCVVQHDRTFLRHVPVKSIVAAMEASASWAHQEGSDGLPDQVVKSVGLLTRSNMNYLQRVVGRPSFRGHHLDIELLTWKPLELRTGGGANQPKLIPLLQFYDSTHIALTRHYLDFVFDAETRLVSRGGFVEDRLSGALLQSIRRFGLVVGHRPFGCYLFDDGLCWSNMESEGRSASTHVVGHEITRQNLQRGAHRLGVGHVGHLDGGSFISTDAEREHIIAVSREKSSRSSEALT